MNILRWKRKSKKKIKLKTLLLFSFSLIMTTFAWFAYSKVLNTSLNIHVSSWDMKYYIGGVEQENPENGIAMGISTMYPAMPEQTVTMDIINNGERTAAIDYYIRSISIAGVSYELVQEGKTPTSTNYVILTPVSVETDATTGEQTVKGAIINDITRFPFTLEVEHSSQIDPYGVDLEGNTIGGEGYLKIIANWIGDNDELESEWGYIVGQYLDNNPTATSVISINLAIDSYQIEEELEQTVIMPSTSETTPYLPTGFVRVPGTTLETGLVIKDASGNEYVWVEVPKNSTVYPNAGLSITGFSDTEYTAIETDLKAYSAAYRTRDEAVTNHYQSIGIADTIYNNLKNTMLKSVYQNGGFYVGRYETGIKDAPRTSYTTTTPQVAVVQKNAYPYNYVSISQAYSLASGMASGDKTSSLMFGLQWDLLLKYLSTKGIDTSEDCTLLGNYYNNLYYLTNRKAKYSSDNGTTWLDAPYEKYNQSSLHLTTGANTTFSLQNIYDIPGNLSEWTFNVIYSNAKPIGGNGGDYTDTVNNLATYCGEYITTTGHKQVGFRVTIY